MIKKKNETQSTKRQYPTGLETQSSTQERQAGKGGPVPTD